VSVDRIIALLSLVLSLTSVSGAHAQSSYPDVVGEARERGDDEDDEIDEDDEDYDDEIDEDHDDEIDEDYDDEIDEDFDVSPMLPPRDPTLERQAGDGAVGNVRVRPGSGVAITSDDGDYELRIGLRGQLRATVDVSEAGDVGADLALRRARLSLSGHAFGPDFVYHAQLAFSPADLGLDESGTVTRSPLLDWLFELRHLRDVEIVLGQYKRPFARERLTSSGSLALVDRSLVDSELQLDRDLGLHLQSRDLFGLGWLRYYAGVSINEGRDGDPTRDLGFLYFARVEILPLGIFDDHTQTDFDRRQEARLSVGAAYAFGDDSPRLKGLHGDAPLDGGVSDYHHAAVDLLLLFGGLTVEADALLRFGHREPGGAVDETGAPLPVDPPSNGVGVFLQISYLLPWIDLEIGGRASILRALGDDTGFEDRGELGGGVAYYIARHALSIHLDAFHYFGRTLRDDPSQQVRLQVEGIF